MPPSNTGPLRDPASSRTAACDPFCQGEASWARASIGESDVNAATAKSAADREARKFSTRSSRLGTIAFIKRP
jgi:hypothetical protein